MQDPDEDAGDSNAPLLPLSKKGISLRPRAIARWVVLRPFSLLRSARRHPRTLVSRLPVYLLILLLIFVAATPIFFPSYNNPPKRYRDLESRCRKDEAGCANPRGEKVFITVSLYDPDGSIAGGAWGLSVERLIHALGEDNVFLSIYENDSGPDGDAALRTLDSRIASPKRIVSDLEPPNYAAFPHATMPDGTRVLKRLSYLSTIRNRAFEPLDRFDNSTTTTKFDKVLFLSDAVFNPLDAAHLLFNTNADETGRARYLSACALDYNQNPFLFYDLYAQRDASGFSNGLPIFPYFAPAGDEASRRAMLAETDAVPVKSCWGGMVAAQAAPFQNMEPELPHPEWGKPGHHVVDPDAPRAVSAPVRFRFEPEIFFDACECCLLQADIAAVAGEAGAEAGVYVNPYVRVAYSERVLRLIPYVRRFERLFSPVQRLISRLVSLPTHNPHREVAQGEPFLEEVFTRRGEWEIVERRGRNGMFCGVREMQTITFGIREEGKKGEGLVNWVDWDVPWEGQRFYFPT
ncbi:hypothetical protein VUR80DRAFT_2236 [Thermomyces stellatus]